jgi:GGDEF domain-containing protein
MTSRIRNISIFIIIAVITLVPYYLLRSRNIEKQYLNGVKEKTEMIKSAVDMLAGEESPDAEKVKKVFNEIVINEPATAALIFTDRFDRLKYLIKNDSLVRSGMVVDHIIKDIKEKKFIKDTGTGPFIKNYGDGKDGNNKFIVSPVTTKDQKAFAVYAFKLDYKTMTRLGLEVLLIMSFCFMITGVILSLLIKKGITEDVNIRTIVLGAKKDQAADEEPGKSSRKAGVQKADQVEVNELTPLLGTGGNRNRNEMARKDNIKTEAAADSLNDRIFELFRKIHRELRPETIALYIKKMEGRLSKSYELREKAFLRIDSSLFDNIKISEIENIKISGAHIIDDGKVIRIPLIDDESLLGLIEIRLRDSVSALDLGKLHAEVKDTARDIREFLVINNVIVDRETGFYSESYFNMKLAEQIYSAQKINTDFFLILIDIFSGRNVTHEQRKTVLKIIYPVIKKSSGEAHELFLYRDRIAMILAGATLKQAEEMELAVARDIAKFRIKLSHDTVIKIQPVVIVKNSRDSENIKEILAETVSALE